MSSAAEPTAAFLAAIQASSLLAPDRLKELADWVAQNRPDVPSVAKEVNRRGWLTPYQIKEVFKGRGKELLLGPYVLLDLLGEGGMGRVFKVHNTRLGRDEALKVIRKEKLNHPQAEARFNAEMQALGQMTHPNVVTAFDAGPLGDTHFVAMEYIDGSDLTRMVRERGPLAVPAACEYIRQAALGLQHAFEKGMVHRDIKPSNLLATRDGRTVKLVDLGLARLEEPGGPEGHRITQEGFVIGTPDFLAPEQARNPAGVDIRADIYALGATLFYILTAKVPFDGGTPSEKLVRHCTEPPPPLRSLRPDAPSQLEAVIQWCLAKRAEDRPQTPIQLAAALQPFCPPSASGNYPAQRGPVAPPLPYPPRLPAPVLPLPPVAPDRSSQVFRLPAQSNDADPIRERAAGRFPVGYLLVAVGAVLVAGIFAFAAYLVFTKEEKVPPIESVTNAVGMKMLKIEGGTFRMGSAEKSPGHSPEESPQRDVTIGGPFLMSATEVSYNHYIRVMGTAQSVGSKKAAGASEHPMEAVSYDDAREFCAKLTDKEKGQPHARPGWAYRLPTEAEWEYCCRAGTDTPFAVGNRDKLVFRPAVKQALFNVTGTDPLEDGDAVEMSSIPYKVGRFEPNPWGLYDMHGNVAEWCLDWYRPSYPDGPAENPIGPASGDKRVVRGGSFKDAATLCRSSARIAQADGDASTRSLRS